MEENQEKILQDKNPIAPPQWMITTTYLAAGAFVLVVALGVVSNLLQPKATVFDIPSQETTGATESEPPVYRTNSEIQREAALTTLRLQCNQLLDEEIAIANNQLIEMRARRWEIYAQAEAPRSGLTSYQFLVEQYQGVVLEIKKISAYGSFNPLPEDSKKLRELIGTAQEIKFAMTKRPDTPHPNINMVALMSQLNDCDVAAISYNNVLDFGAAEAGYFRGGNP